MNAGSFRRLHADSGQMILLITHDRTGADAAGRLVTMRDVRVVDAHDLAAVGASAAAD